MADRIKGITVEIGGDTTKLSDALKDVSKTSGQLQRELGDVNRLLKFDPNNAELVAQKTKLMADQIQNAEKKLNKLKDAQASVQAQFDSGDMGIEQYNAFQREIQDTQSYLRNMQNSLQDLEKEQSNIQSSTKELDRLFEVTGKTLDDFSDVIGDRMVRAIQQGTASSRDLKKAFDNIAKASVGASADVGEVRQALQRLESGEQSIKNVRRELQKMGEDAKDTAGDVKNLGGELGGLVAGAGAGMGLGAIFEKAMDISDLDTTIEISMDIPDESKQAVKDSIKTVGSYIDDNETALEGVRKQFQLNADLTDAENQKILKGAGTISKAYAEVDFSELIQETNEMTKGLGVSQETALGMTKTLLDMGFPPDQLDIISEYGSQLHRAGFSASEVQGIFQAGIETKSWNIDVLLDGLKEGRIGLAEMGTGVDDATAKILQGTGIQASQVQEWGKAVASGGDAGKDAMMEVALALAGVEDETKRNELGVKLYGTLWEEQGKNITDTILGAKDTTVDLAEGTRQLNEDTAKLDASPQQQLNQALTTLWETLRPLLIEVTNFVTKIAEWIQKNPEITAGIVAFVSVLGILIGIFLILSPIIMGIVTLAGTLGVTVGAIALPILIVIGVIGLLIAIGVALWKNWDEIMAWGKKTWKSVSESFENMWNAVAEWMGNLWSDVKDIWGNVMDFFEEIDLVQTGKDIIQGLIDGISQKATALWNKATEIARSVGNALDNVFDFGSPSKLTTHMGEMAGEGIAVGLGNTMKQVKKMSAKMGEMAMPKIEQPEIETGMSGSVGSGKNLTVNIHSPKALDIRQASKEFNKTLNKMSLMW